MDCQIIQLRITTLNRDACKGAVATIAYSTTAPAPVTGTFTYVGNILTISDVAVWPTATGDMTVQAGDELSIHSVAPLGTYDIIIVAAVNGEFNLTSAPNGYYTTGALELERGGVNYLRSPAWVVK